MNRYEIITALDSEILRLQEARLAITLFSSTRARQRPQAAIRPAATPKRKGISEAGRKRIAEAQRKRWAAQKVETRKEIGMPVKNAGKNTRVAITTIPPKQPRERTRIQRS